MSDRCCCFRIRSAVDTAVDPAFLALGGPGFTGPTRPVFSFTERDIWVQGFTVGLEWRYPPSG